MRLPSFQLVALRDHVVMILPKIGFFYMKVASFYFKFNPFYTIVSSGVRDIVKFWLYPAPFRVG